MLVGAASVALAFHAYGPTAYDPNAAGRLLVLQLSERLGYQAMNFHDWLGSLILPLPFVGGWLEFLFSDDTARRLAHGYTALGREEIFPRAVAQSPSPLTQYAWLARTYIEHAFGSYLAATPGILNRGVWGGADIVALVGVFPVKRLLAYSAADGRCGALAMVPGADLRPARRQHAAQRQSGVGQCRYALRLGLRHRLRRRPLSIVGRRTRHGPAFSRAGPLTQRLPRTKYRHRLSALRVMPMRTELPIFGAGAPSSASHSGLPGA